MRRLLALLVLAAITGLVPLAHASPPDQTWIPGFYDNADYDDVILTATSTAGALDGGGRPALPLLDVAPLPAPADITAPAPGVLRSRQPRGPPSR